jgi:hypothetical protein
LRSGHEDVGEVNLGGGVVAPAKSVKPFRLTLIIGLVGLRAQADTILPPPITVAHCVVDQNSLDGPTGCALNDPGSASASLTLSPFVDLTAEATSPPNDGVIHGAAAAASLTYSFEIIGGNSGDLVPLLIATSLSTFGSDTTHGVGFAELFVHTSAGGDSFVAVCSDGTCGTTASSFSGTLSTRARSGDVSNTLTLQVQASTGDSLSAQSASASADPFIFIDPSFASASLYSIVVSAGVGNALPSPTTVPEPAPAALFGLGILFCAAARKLGGQRRNAWGIARERSAG